MTVGQLTRSPQRWSGVLVPAGLMLAWDVVVTLVYQLSGRRDIHIELQLSLFGTGVALFLGFAVNAAYARWWEARTLWGAVVNASRSLGRQVLTLADGDSGEVGRRAVLGQIAYVHALRTSLRDQPLPPEAVGRLEGLGVDPDGLRPQGILLAVARLVQSAGAMFGPQERVRLETTLTALTDAQGGLERIKNTPLPVQYRFFPAFFARALCVVLPLAVVTDLGWFTPLGSGLIGLMFLMAVQASTALANPFDDDVHDVPMTALSATVEADLLRLLDGAPVTAG